MSQKYLAFEVHTTSLTFHRNATPTGTPVRSEEGLKGIEMLPKAVRWFPYDGVPREIRSHSGDAGSTFVVFHRAIAQGPFTQMKTIQLGLSGGN